MDNSTIEALKNVWFTYEEIQDLIESEKDIENGLVYDFETVKQFSRKELFSNSNYVWIK